MSATTGTHEPITDEHAKGSPKGTDESLRFGFGRNWSDFIEQHFSDARVESSREHLLRALRLETLAGLSFLDIGCGSGLHSLAALRAGARAVVGFDFDRDSVATSIKVRDMTVGASAPWTVEQGSVLDDARMRQLAKADIVYSWGVLHHTGEMWKAMENAVIPRKPDGVVYIALYSSDQYVDPPAGHWVRIKRDYNQRGALGKRLMEWTHASRLFYGGLVNGQMPWSVMRNSNVRGMDFWTDIRDWLGGWPIEFASYVEVEQWGARHGLSIVNAIVGEGCTEYVLADTRHNAKWAAEEQRRLASRKPLVGPFTQQMSNGRPTRAWIAPLKDLKDFKDLAGRCDQSLAPRGSRVMLYDGDRAFGLPHFMHDHVHRYGSGRFSHWQDYVLFSTPDGSDPNIDPSRWSYCADY